VLSDHNPGEGSANGVAIHLVFDARNLGSLPLEAPLPRVKLELCVVQLLLTDVVGAEQFAGALQVTLCQLVAGLVLAQLCLGSTQGQLMIISA
jgi:hypothetical protein